MKGMRIGNMVAVFMLAVFCCFFTFAGDRALAAGGDVIRMKLANANPAGDIKDQVALRFKELVEKKSNGKVVIEVYSGGTLGDWREAIEGLGMGIDEIVLESMGGLDAWTKLANIDAVPYIYRDYDHFIAVWYGDLGKKMLETVGEQGGFKLLAPMYRGARIVTTKVPFTNLKELKGLKMRVPNIAVYIETWKTLGAAPTPLALTETFTALQQNTVVAQENPTIESYGHGFYDVCKYLVTTNHVFSADMFIFNRKYFNGLSPEVQKIITDSANEAAKWRNELAVKKEADYFKMFRDKGVTIIEPKREEFIAAFDGFVDKVFPYLKEWTTAIKEVK